MKSKIVFRIGVFLLLGGLLASELGLHFLTERIPIVSPSYRGWGEPAFYRLNREDSNAGHKWLVFLKLTGVVSLVGFTLVYLELRKCMVPTQRGPGTVEGLTKLVERARMRCSQFVFVGRERLISVARTALRAC